MLSIQSLITNNHINHNQTTTGVYCNEVPTNTCVLGAQVPAALDLMAIMMTVKSNVGWDPLECPCSHTKRKDKLRATNSQSKVLCKNHSFHCSPRTNTLSLKIKHKTVWTAKLKWEFNSVLSSFLKVLSLTGLIRILILKMGTPGWTQWKQTILNSQVTQSLLLPVEVAAYLPQTSFSHLENPVIISLGVYISYYFYAQQWIIENNIIQKKGRMIKNTYSSGM